MGLCDPWTDTIFFINIKNEQVILTQKKETKTDYQNFTHIEQMVLNETWTEYF